MSLNNHGLPSRVPVIAEIGRMLGNPQVPEADKHMALELLEQDHADLDEVEVQSALWALAQIGQMPPQAMARQVLLGCAPAWLTNADTAQLFLDSYQLLCGTHLVAGAEAAFAQLQALAAHDADLAARLGRFAMGGATPETV